MQVHDRNSNGHRSRNRARSVAGRRLEGWLLLLAFGATLVTASHTKAEVARYEMLPFVSATMSDNEFLSGADGIPTMLAGQLRLPTEGKDRLPTMLIIHGSSGVGGTDGISDHAAKQLNKLGIATFVMDSFSPRGLTSTVTDQSLLGRLQMIYDAYRALELLAKHPRIDPERIGVIGTSRGAEASIFAAMDRFREMHGPEHGLRFAAYVGFSTPCGREYLDRTSVADRPILLLHGEADDWTPVDACEAYIEELQQAGADARLISYPHTGHAFEAPAVPTVFIKQAQNSRHCRIGENANHEVVDLDTGKAFDWNTNACVERGASVGFVEAASRQAENDLAEFLDRVFH
jgi:dienelactone hydrolase